MEGCLALLFVLALWALVNGAIWYAIWNWLIVAIFPNLPYLGLWKCLLLGILVSLILRPTVTIKR